MRCFARKGEIERRRRSLLRGKLFRQGIERPRLSVGNFMKNLYFGVRSMQEIKLTLRLDEVAMTLLFFLTTIQGQDRLIRCIAYLEDRLRIERSKPKAAAAAAPAKKVEFEQDGEITLEPLGGFGGQP
jgi:hypothetical protein